MSLRFQGLDGAVQSELATTIRNAGISGAGGAGFPTHAKWNRLDEVDHLLVNHQESEPNFYIDKWLGREYADEFAQFFEALLDGPLQTVVVGAKAKDREEWMGPLEDATDGAVYGPDDLPFDPETESGVVFAYTEDRYEYGMESVLLRLVANTVIGDDLPMDHGWIVQNTETLHNVLRTLTSEEAMTRKYVHVDGNVSEHRFLDAPVGTPAATLLERAGRSLEDLADDEILADGGPGWCFEIQRSPSSFGIRKRSNCVLVLDEGVVRENTLGAGRINVVKALEWDDDHETEPVRIEPDRVQIPLLSNPAFEGTVARSQPIVERGENVDAGQMIAVPDDAGISNAQHASIPGRVTAVSESHVEITRGESASVGTPERTIYWTWCVECGAYVPIPETEKLESGTRYRCEDCR
jgi:Na+-translocating ferredoxin:NAD+ oxidoreductase RnfC subunit/DNA-directed RNA polymerase subunit RPC12/RpoP